MRRHWDKIFLLHFKCALMTLAGCLLTAVLWLMSSVSVLAQSIVPMSDIEQSTFGEYAYVNADYETMRNIRRYWVQSTQQMRPISGIDYKLTGSNDGVLKITMPASMLFHPGDSTLLNQADGYLRQVLKLIDPSEALVKVVIGCYSDNNGTDNYLTKLTRGRAYELHRWFARQGLGPQDVRSFGFANKVPLNNNSTMEERRLNRRVCIYLIPGKRMIRLAKKDKLELNNKSAIKWQRN